MLSLTNIYRNIRRARCRYLDGIFIALLNVAKIFDVPNERARIAVPIEIADKVMRVRNVGYAILLLLPRRIAIASLRRLLLSFSAIWAKPITAFSSRSASVKIASAEINIENPQI